MNTRPHKCAKKSCNVRTSGHRYCHLHRKAGRATNPFYHRHSHIEFFYPPEPVGANGNSPNAVPDLPAAEDIAALIQRGYTFIPGLITSPKGITLGVPQTWDLPIQADFVLRCYAGE